MNKCECAKLQESVIYLWKQDHDFPREVRSRKQVGLMGDFMENGEGGLQGVECIISSYLFTIDVQPGNTLLLTG